jgi:PAS domain S-box-containing protein
MKPGMNRRASDGPDATDGPKAICERPPPDHDHGMESGATCWLSLFNGIGEPLLLLTPDGVILDVNHALSALLDYPPETLIGQHASLVCPPDGGRQIEACLADAARAGAARHCDGVARTRDGQLIAIDVVASMVRTDAQPMIVAVLHDIRARKTAETNFHVSEQRFYALAELIREIFWVCDPSTRQLLYISPAFADLFEQAGCSLEDAPRTWSEAILPADRPLYEHFLNAQTRGERVSVEVRFRATDGRVRWLHGRAFPWKGDGGRALVAGVAEDITERKEAEAERLALADLRRESLVREAHHRVKNSLQGVVGLLRRWAGRHPALASVLTDAISQVRSIAVIHELQGRSTGEPVLLCELLPMIAGSVENLFDAQVRLRVRNRRETMVALADAETVPLAIVLNELLMNAGKHQRPDTPDAVRYIDIELSGDHDEALIVIGNRGALPPDFDFAAGRALGQGLELLSALLPHDGATLNFSQQDGQVQVHLLLTAPAIIAHHDPAGHVHHV